MVHDAKIGSISHGTLKTDDLLYAFAVELDYLRGNDEATKAMYALTDVDADEFVILDDKEDDARGLLDKLTEELEELAPAYCCFGAHEGDGSDFGFWPSVEAIDDLPRFDDLADVPDDIDDDYVVVNDHGNVSVYGASGKLIWDCV